MRRMLILASWFFLTIPVLTAQDSSDKPASDKPATDQSATPADKPANDKSANPAQLLTNGRITKIDSKKMILTVRNEAEGAAATRNPQTDPRTRQGGYPGGGYPGGGYPGGRRRGGVGFPGGGGGRFPGGGGGRRTPPPAAKDQGKEFKVYIKDETAINDADKRLSFSNLVIGDRITIQGLPKGKGDDLEASKITLTH